MGAVKYDKIIKLLSIQKSLAFQIYELNIWQFNFLKHLTGRILYEISLLTGFQSH